MMHMCEFEVFEDNGVYLAYPFGMEGGTQGNTIEEAAFMAADWFKIEIEHRVMHNLPFPKVGFGNELQHDGERLLVAVDVGKEAIDKMSAADAARTLGVTPGRITQMVAAGLLEGFKDGHKSWITRASVEARLVELPKAGRPKKTAMA